MDYWAIVGEAGWGFAAGCWIATIGYLRASLSTDTESTQLTDKLIAAKFEGFAKFLPTVGITGLLGAATALLIYAGVPPQTLLLLVPVAMREQLNDLIDLSGSLFKAAKPPAKPVSGNPIPPNPPEPPPAPATTPKAP